MANFMEDTLKNRSKGHHQSNVYRDLIAQPEGNSGEGSEGGELPKIVDEYEGYRLAAEKDGTFALYTEKNERLLQTMLSDRTEELFVVEERDEIPIPNFTWSYTYQTIHCSSRLELGRQKRTHEDSGVGSGRS